jgi:glycosyltransferase involved in cell wall biosynthesis
MAEARPLITTVIPTYRRPRLLVRAVRSVLRQTVQDFQVIVYDNASGDETGAVVAELAARDARVRYYRQERNLGPDANFNFAMSRVETEYFSMLSDDDLLMPYFYEQALAGFVAYPSAVSIASPLLMVDEDGHVLRLGGRDWPPGFYPPPSAMLRMAEHEHLTWTGMLFRRQVLENGPIDAETGMASDLDWLLRLTGSRPIAMAQRPGAVLSIHSASASSTPQPSHYWPSWSRIIANAGRDQRVPEGARLAAQRGLDRRLARALLVTGIFACSRAEYEQANGAAAVLHARYRRRLTAIVLRLLAITCRMLPPGRRLLTAAVNWWRWRRPGGQGVEQEALGRYPGLLEVPGEISRQAA